MTDGRHAYLRYLPAIFAAQSEPFLGDFLDIFQKLLTGLDDDQLGGRKAIQQVLAAEVIGALFYPRFGFLFPGNPAPIPPISGLPPTQQAALLDLFNTYVGVAAAPTGDPRAPFVAWLNDFLGWLGGWVDLVQETAWSIDKKRMVIAQILALYRVRGTPQGMNWLVNLWLDLPLTVTGRKADGTATTGKVTITIANPAPPAITLADRAGQKGAFVLRERAQAGMPLVSGMAPWLFTATITLPTTDAHFILDAAAAAPIRALQADLRRLLERVKPAGSEVRIVLVPGLNLTALDLKDGTKSASQLGRNTFLGTGGTA